MIITAANLVRTGNGDAGAAIAQDVVFPHPAAFVLAASANIAAAAVTATTAQLAAPAGKTTANFQAGRISDDTNPLPSLDPAADVYLELEFSIQSVTGAVANGEAYEFALFDDWAAFNSYPVLAGLTIGAAGSSGVATLDFAGSGVGASDKSGSGVGALTFAGSATGASSAAGSGAAALTFGGTGAGASGAAGSGASSLTFAGAGAGASAKSGSGSAALTFGGSASGAAEKSGSGAAAITFSGSAAGAAAKSGSGTAPLTFGWSAAGASAAAGSGSAALTFGGSGTGTNGGTGSAALTFAGTGASASAKSGAGTTSVTFSGSAGGASGVAGSGAVAVTFGGAGAGTSAAAGSGTASLTFGGAGAGAVGSVLVIGTPTIDTIGVTSVSISVAPATGGTPPYTYAFEWTDDLNAGFTHTTPVPATASTSATISGLSPETAHWFKAVAYDSVGDESLSAVVSATTLPAPPSLNLYRRRQQLPVAVEPVGPPSVVAVGLRRSFGERPVAVAAPEAVAPRSMSRRASAGVSVVPEPEEAPAVVAVGMKRNWN